MLLGCIFFVAFCRWRCSAASFSWLFAACAARLHLFLDFLRLALLAFGFFVSVWVQQEDFPKEFQRFRAIIRIEYTQLGITRLLRSPVPNFSVPSQNIDHFMRDITYYWFLGKFCLGTILQSASFCAQQNKLNEISLNSPATGSYLITSSQPML